MQESINTRLGAERCIRFAFEFCRKRNYRKKLTLCGKTNVLTYAFDLWQRAFNDVAKEYPDMQTDYAHVDAICMWMVKNPEWFDVIVTDNMFGDIITDLGAMIQGGMGIAAGGNINPNGVSMFEPIGGSAPKYTGLNVINPIAAIAGGPDDAGAPWRDRRRRAYRKRHKKGGVKRSEEPCGGPHGPLDNGGGRPGGELYNR